MVHLNRLEGPALEAYLKMRRQVMKEAARINNMSWKDAWATSEPTPGSETYANLLPGPEAALKVEDLIYTDLGQANIAPVGGQFWGLASGQNVTQINLNIPAGRVVGIYGVSIQTANPALVQIDVNIGGRTAREWPTRPGWSEINDQMYFLDPVIIPGTKQLTVDFWEATATSPEQITFLGVYAEPKA